MAIPVSIPGLVAPSPGDETGRFRVDVTNTMAVDAMAPWVAHTSAVMTLAVLCCTIRPCFAWGRISVVDELQNLQLTNICCLPPGSLHVAGHLGLFHRATSHLN